ncbi:hypothetical protein VSDG_04380 [Cytospora chrysosperma]|uniref:MIF4G domain-containing protein n=1 Tax=Cytospora chrysosperma TaxID=252740 RepID=A0A423W4D6_CYTCH|nr:hypothetical protein VSDG_04380 [Valsa sordida]
MTSTASQPNTTPAPNNTAASSAPSYASAAGATKKPASTPLVVTGATNSSATVNQHAKTSSVSNMNGRSSVTPAVPTVAATPSVNGGSADHSRNGSVTIAANGPNSYLANGGTVSNKPPGIQFGYADASPAMPHSTPQQNSSAPMPIPGAGRAVSPATSPLPIPQLTSGGKPGNTENSFKIGSYTNDGDRIGGRPNSMTQVPFHARRDSAVSQHSDMGHHGQGPSRGGYGGGRGRGGYNSYNNGQMGFPPATNQYPRGQGRGGMPPQQFGRGGMQPYPNSPQTARGSPAMPPAMPGQGTPNMTPVMPVPPAGYSHQFVPPMGGFPQQGPQVKTPIYHEVSLPSKSYNKKKSARLDAENRPSRQPDPSSFSSWQDVGGRPRRLSKRRDSFVDYDRPLRGRGPSFVQQPLLHNPSFLLMNEKGLDLSPGPDGGYERFERLLTATTQTFYPNFDPNRGYMGMPSYPPQMHAPMYPSGSPAPGAFAHPYSPGFVPPQGQPMSRNNSQMSERPASSTGQNQGPIVVSGAPQSHNLQAKLPVVASTPNQFQKPKKAGITIKNAAGEVVNLANLADPKAPSSPAPSIQQSKTPPVIASTPTPPPKSSTPAPHSRTESTAKPDDIKAAFLEQVKKSKESDKADAAEAEAKSKEEERVEAEKKAAEAKAAEEKAAEEAKAAREAKAAEEKKAAEEAKVAQEAKVAKEAKDAEDAKAAAVSKAAEKPAETEDEYMERMIREMEEEDARREAEQAEITAKKNIEKEAAKKKAEADRIAQAAENDRKLKEQEAEMERLEEEKEKAREKARLEAESSGPASVSQILTNKISDLTASQKKDSAETSSKDAANSSAKSIGKERAKPAALNLTPLKTSSVEAPLPSAAMQALKSARFLTMKDEIKYPNGIASPNPALNPAAAKKGGSFKYDSAFLMQFQKVFTEQPSVEFSQQVKALIGDSDGSRSASSRTPAGGSGRQGSRNAAGNFGAFAQPAGGKPLPPGTTSDQRFAMSQGQISRPAIGGPIGSFRGGAFPAGNQMSSRTPSSSMAQSGSRAGSRTQGGRGNTGKRFGAGDNKQNMPLTAGMDLKPIAVTATGWKPKSLAKGAQQPDASGHLDPEVVQRKVKAALNKMTPENFDRISDQILLIAAQSKDEQDGRTLRQVIQLTFEKATDEAHWAAMYAKFCKRMLETMSPEVKDVTIKDKNGNIVNGGALFRKYLLNRCQEDFERGWAVEMPAPKEGETKEMTMLSDEYYAAMAVKRRGLGLVQFIGELFKLGMLTERIMHECVRKLLDFQDQPDEAEIESLSKLLRTIGANLDSTEKGQMMMNAYFERISTLMETPDLPSRLHFMLLDIVDLRRARWVSKEGLKGPKTLEEIRADAEHAAAQKAAENARTNSRNAGGRSQMGRGDARGAFSYQQPTSNQVGMDDLRRLKGSAPRTASSNLTLGPTSMFANSRSSSGRRLGPGGSLSRGGADDSGPPSRSGTPSTHVSMNAFAALANMESENPASPPSTSASPALNHAKPTPPPGEKKEAE